jgi:predicted Zn-dependent protease
MRAREWISAFLCPVFALLGCAVNPVTGQPQVILVSDEREAQLGREGAERVVAEMGIVEDARLSKYVGAVGGRVAEHAPRRSGVAWSFQIVNQREPNAFALPDGHVFVSRGLLAIANSEDELASVLAHEIVHVAARHHAQQQTRATGYGILALPGRLAGAVIGGPVGDLIAAPGMVMGAGLFASYGRDQERESDRVGQEITAKAGYDPGALASFLRTLEAATRSEGDARGPSFFDTHPSTPERVVDAASRAEQISWTRAVGIAADRADFVGRLDGLLLGLDPAQGIFRKERFLHPDLDFTIRFPEGWKTANAPAAVAAVPERGDAIAILQAAAEGDDPEAVARAFFEELSRQTRIDVQRRGSLEIAGLRAYRLEGVVGTSQGASTLDLFWIAHGGVVYLLAGRVDGAYAARYRGVFEQVARSFRPLSAAERASIEELRLRVVAAGAGETFATLGRRTGNAWEPRETAIANGVGAGERLAAGWPVKVARSQAYTGGR